MKALKELNLKKIFKSLLKGSFKTKAFLISFGIFFSTLAFAAALTVTWLSSHMGPKPTDAGLSCFTHPNADHPNGELIDSDGAQEPEDLAFSNDGLTYFVANKNMIDPTGYDIVMYKLTVPFDLNTMRNDCSQNRFDLGLLARGDGSGPLANGSLNSEYGRLYDMEFSPDGHKIFLVNGLTSKTTSGLLQFSLSKAFDLKTAKFDTHQNFTRKLGSVAFNRDGTKMFYLDGSGSGDATVVETYDLGSPFDITSITLVHTLDLSGTELNSADGNQFGVDMNFNDTGSAFFILINDGPDRSRSAIYQFRLGKNYDMSTASLVGSSVVLFNGASGLVTGFGFGDGGMKLYVINAENFSATVDQTSMYQLECPYGVVECVSNPTASIGSQVELAKQNIDLNISSIFRRFEWIKRNRDGENFTSHNININYPNPLLKSLAMNLKPATKEKLATLVSTQKKDQKMSKWSSWSLGDLSLSHFDKLGFENAKNIRNEGIIFGADRKFSDNKFFGWAIRYGNGSSNIVQTKQNIHMDSLTLNLYGIMPKDKENYLNAVLGLSALKIDSHYLGKKSGQRYGKQLFTAIDFRTKNSYGKLNLTPTTKFTFGITRLGEYTDFLSDVIDSPTLNIRYDEDTFTTGQISSGFLFEADQIIVDDKIFQPMGGIEFYYDLSRDIDYDYSLVGSNQVNTDTIHGAYNRVNLRTSLGFELIYPNGLTLSPLYEKTFAIKGSTLNRTLLGEGITERFIIKISRSKEMDGNNFALDFDPLNQNYANVSFNKNFGNLNLKVNSNYNLFSKIPDYGANLEISGTF